MYKMKKSLICHLVKKVTFHIMNNIRVKKKETKIMWKNTSSNHVPFIHNKYRYEKTTTPSSLVCNSFHLMMVTNIKEF